MKLATLRDGSRDGRLVIVSKELTRYQLAPCAFPTLQSAIDDWASAHAALSEAVNQLEAGQGHPFDAREMMSPLPRAYQWADGSAYINHIELLRKARQAEMPAGFLVEPLIYQGGSDSFLAPTDPILAESDSLGIDLEAEIAVIVDDVPMGISAQEASEKVRLVMLVNDVTYRGLTKSELAKGFGFFQSKPSSAFSPVAVTPDELGDVWDDSRVHLPLCVDVNGAPFGRAEAGVGMIFSFADLICHAARTRPLVAGSIIGSGTVSNKFGDQPGLPIHEGGVGYSCLAEVRMIETIRNGKPSTPFLQFGDEVKIWMEDKMGHSIFGVIEQKVLPYGG